MVDLSLASVFTWDAIYYWKQRIQHEARYLWAIHVVHHGSNRRYLDRNHGSILIIWDRLFGTFEPEDEPVRYRLTNNIDIASDVARSQNWADRVGFVVRGPGWAYQRRSEMVGV